MWETDRTWPVVTCHCLKCVSVINAIGASHQHILSDLRVKNTEEHQGEGCRMCGELSARGLCKLPLPQVCLV